MRILIDMQGAQAASRSRGIGRYSFELTRSVLRNSGDVEVHLLLNGEFADSVLALKRAFGNDVPASRIHVWYPPGDIRGRDPRRQKLRRVAEAIREGAIRSVSPDVVHVLSPFEGETDDAVFAVDSENRSYRLTATVYDLIPLENPKIYFGDRAYRRFYRRQFTELTKADAFLAISASAVDEVRKHVGDEKVLIVNVGTATSAHFTFQKFTARKARAALQSLRVDSPFLLYYGGFYKRKNVETLISAFSQLDPEVRESRQLVLAGTIYEDQRANLGRLVRELGLQDKVVFTGQLSDERLALLSSTCELFVFPSLHEGFGLPVLEAMSSGAPVIASSSSSIPEVVDFDEALFDPRDVRALTALMRRGIADPVFREKLIRNSKRRADFFNWDRVAQRVLDAWNEISSSTYRPDVPVATAEPGRWDRPRLFVITPYPPDRTGVADYSQELVRALMSRYRVVVVSQSCPGKQVVDGVQVRSIDWFRAHVRRNDRVLYHMGNSEFHGEMPDLLREFPGVVALHDVFVGDLLQLLDNSGAKPHSWTRELYKAHGLEALRKRYHDAPGALTTYPASLDIVQHAHEVIVHSDFARMILRKAYGPVAEKCTVIGLLREPLTLAPKSLARSQLGLPEDAFIVATFGLVADRKMIPEIVRGWDASNVAKNVHSRLLVVGGGNVSDFLAVQEQIESSVHGQRIGTIGRVGAEEYRLYLAAADVAIQLRRDSRGETSAAVLDCLNAGLATVVNSHGGLEEVDQNAVVLIPGEVTEKKLSQIIDRLHAKPEERNALGIGGRESIVVHNSPEVCAQRYATVIERSHRGFVEGESRVLEKIASSTRGKFTDSEQRRLAIALAANYPLQQPRPRIFLDVTSTRELDIRTGIQRVAKAILLAMLNDEIDGWRVEPVYIGPSERGWDYFYARRFAESLAGFPTQVLEDERVEFLDGDVVITLDMSGITFSWANDADLFVRTRARGVQLFGIVYDLLPITMPDVFPEGAAQSHEMWLNILCRFDAVAAISKTVADDAQTWVDKRFGEDDVPARVTWFPLGADFDEPMFEVDLSSEDEELLDNISQSPTFLMVGTIEPRKGYDQVLDAFQTLWSQGVDANLVIIGKPGWSTLPDEQRRNIPEIERTLGDMIQSGNSVYWLGQASDALLKLLYEKANCLIAASYDEGFGLPLIEAAHYGLPILARDIPVFREVAGSHAAYFANGTPDDVAKGVRDWLARESKGKTIESTDMTYLSWRESAHKLLHVLGITQDARKSGRPQRATEANS